MIKAVITVLVSVLSIFGLSNSICIAEDRIRLIAAFGNPHPPLVIDKVEGAGLVYDTIDLMNRFSDKYVIETISVPPKRIYSDFRKMKIDLVPYTNVNWGWKKRGADASITLIHGRDVFFKRRSPASPAPDQDTIGAVLGFHYAFAGYSQDILSSMPNVTLVQNEQRVVQQVLKGRVHRGVVSESYLGWLSVSDIGSRAMLTVLPEVDHTYERQFVRLPGAKIQIEELDALFSAPGFWTELGVIFKKYGQQLRPLN